MGGQRRTGAVLLLSAQGDASRPHRPCLSCRQGLKPRIPCLFCLRIGPRPMPFGSLIPWLCDQACGGPTSRVFDHQYVGHAQSVTFLSLRLWVRAKGGHGGHADPAKGIHFCCRACALGRSRRRGRGGHTHGHRFGRNTRPHTAGAGRPTSILLYTVAPEKMIGGMRTPNPTALR
jgi:hypothetical protein